ncbi:MAG: hypothetical protein NC489_31330 [Ruminococcus flavefaciens]|nr:hypothetical protein [Ruminococcus flavefaciens]
MAKKIRFPLEMDNGIEVRDMEGLKEHFSLTKVLEHFESGKLAVWLRDHYENNIADAVEALEKNEQELAKKLSEIFDIPYDENAEEELEKAAERAERLERLKEYTENEQFWDKVDNVVFEQDELYDLLDEEAETIYLCGERFSIPLSKPGVKYIGINNPTAVIDSKVLVDWDEKKISIEGIVFDDKYQKIVNENSQKFIEEENEKNCRLELLRKYGINECKLDKIAFNQEELNELLGRYVRLIYLYGEQFSIPLDMIMINHVKIESSIPIKFKGINNPTVVIKSSLYDFLENKEVYFEDIRFADDNYRKANYLKEAYDNGMCSLLRFTLRLSKSNIVTELSIHELFRITAFDQADLSRLLQDGADTICLAGKGPFHVFKYKNIRNYIGIYLPNEDRPTVIIDDGEYRELEKAGSTFEEIDIELESIFDYMEFSRAYEKRCFQELFEGEDKKASNYEHVEGVYDNYKNFMKNYWILHPECNLTSEDGYKKFFDSCSSGKDCENYL